MMKHEMERAGVSKPRLFRSPSIALKGENLVYYRNIEYLKEMTRQAQALLDRSNAQYENILDDLSVGDKVRARSVSDNSKSASPEMEGKCPKCGLAHGTTDFCILEQIMNSEKRMEDEKRKTQRASRGTFFKSWMSAERDSSIHLTELAITSPPLTTSSPKSSDDVMAKINFLDKKTPSQILDMYEQLCFHYGASAGRNFLVAYSTEHPREGKLEKWTTPPSPKGLRELAGEKGIPFKECSSKEKPTVNLLCPDISDEIRQKMVQLVSLVPPCQAVQTHEKKWRAVLRRQQAIKESETTEHQEWDRPSLFPPSLVASECSCKIPTCTCGSAKICIVPEIKKQCQIINHDQDENNYLIAMRNRVQKHREIKRNTSRLFSKHQLEINLKAKRKSDEIRENANLVQYNYLNDCIAKNIKGFSYDLYEFRKNVQAVADVSSPFTPMNHRQWDNWEARLNELEKKEENDEIDSLGSHIQLDEESVSYHTTSTGIDYKAGRIKPSRIPFYEEIYDLIDYLFDKISYKFEKSIKKNSFKVSRLQYRPTFAFLHREMTLLGHVSPLFAKIMELIKFYEYEKRLTPNKIKKMRKLKRLETLEKRLEDKRRDRYMIRGLQQGKRYHRRDKTKTFSPESGYIGFKPQERKILEMTTSAKFAKCNLVGNDRGKAVTVRKIHHDFRLMQRMFKDADRVSRQDLMDEGMKRRWRAFQNKTFYIELPAPPGSGSESVRDDCSEGDMFRVPRKESMELLRAADTGGFDSDIDEQRKREKLKQSSKNAKTNSADDKMKCEEKGVVLRRKITERRHIDPRKSSSVTEVKTGRTQEDISESRNKPKLNRPSRKSGSSTNLLPPLNSKSNSKANTSVSSALIEHGVNRSKVSQNPKDGQNFAKPMPITYSQVLPKLPRLSLPTRSHTKANKSKISAALPQINHRESVENLKPTEEKTPSGRKSKVVLTVLNNQKNADEKKLPLLADMNKHKISSTLSVESLMRRKSTKVDKSLQTPKQTCFKAWR